MTEEDLKRLQAGMKMSMEQIKEVNSTIFKSIGIENYADMCKGLTESAKLHGRDLNNTEHFAKSILSALAGLYMQGRIIFKESK